MIVVADEHLSREDLLGLALHEAAHCLPFKLPVAEPEPTPEQKQRQHDELTAWATKEPFTWKSLPRWFPSHGLPFIRTTLHLHWRAAARAVICLCRRFDARGVIRSVGAVALSTFAGRCRMFCDEAKELSSDPRAADAARI